MLPPNLITGVAAKLPGDWKKQPTARQGGRTRHESGVMNKTERLYAFDLDILQRAGEIKAWWFEPLKVRLARRTYYTPDFLIWQQDGSLEFVEIKGYRKRACDAPGEAKDAVRFKMARELVPWASWRMIERSEGEWREVLK